MSLALMVIFLFEYNLMVRGMTVSPSKPLTQEGDQEVPKSETIDGNTNGNLIQLENRRVNGTHDQGHFFTLGTYAAMGFLVALLAGILIMIVFLVVKYGICVSNLGGRQQNTVEPQRETVRDTIHINPLTY